MTAFAGLPHGHAHVSHAQLPSMQPPYPSQATDSNLCAPSLRAAVQALQSEAVERVPVPYKFLLFCELKTAVPHMYVIGRQRGIKLATRAPIWWKGEQHFRLGWGTCEGQQVRLQLAQAIGCQVQALQPFTCRISAKKHLAHPGQARPAQSF